MNDVMISTLVLPGGTMPVVGRNGDIGYDAHVRAVVTPRGYEDETWIRKTLWNMKDKPKDPLFKNASFQNDRWVYTLHPGEGVCLGLGVVFGGSSCDWYTELAPRSSTAIIKLGIKNYLDGVPIDPNYRSEPMAFIANHGEKPFEIVHGMKLVQFKFFCRCHGGTGFLKPELKQVSTFEELGKTNRGSEWNASSNSKVEQKELALHQ